MKKNVFLITLFACTLLQADLIDTLNDNLTLNSYNSKSNKYVLDDKPILMIGSSYINAKTRIDDDGIASIGGLAVGFGSYYSLGAALIRNRHLNGLIINEGSVGATTFDRFSCSNDYCLSGGKVLGYKSQFKNALKRVAIYEPNNPIPISYNAKYIIIGVPNDCIHSDAFGLPQSETKMCTNQDIDESITRIIDVAKESLEKEITPLVSVPPKYRNLDLKLLKQGFNLNWVINKETYRKYRQKLIYRVKDELGKKYILNIWNKFSHRGDGIHPDRKTVERASRKIVKKLRKLERGKFNEE